MKKSDQPLKVEYWAIRRVKPYGKNARAHPPEQIAKIIASIKSVGFTKPIIVDDRGEILAGHGAHQAALQMGMKEVPVIVRRGLDQATRRAYRLADNAVAEASAWDDVLLAGELADLKEMGVDLALTGFDAKTIEDLLKPPPGRVEEPETPEVPQKAVSEPGDMWLLGDHRLICADSTQAGTYRTLMAGAQAQCVFTDPPYGVSYDKSGKFEMIEGDDLRRGQLAQMLRRALGEALPHTRNDAGWYVWHASATRDDFAKALRDTGLVELGVIIWAKAGAVLGWSDYRWSHEPCFYAARQGVRAAFFGGREHTTVWRCAARSAKGEPVTAIGNGVTITGEASELYLQAGPPKGRKVRHVHLEQGKPVLVAAMDAADDVWEVGRDAGHGKEGSLHPTQKPVELARRAIGNSSRVGDAVLDPFSGSASTLIACEQMGRVAYACDLDPRYVDVGVRRWQALTGKEAIHAAKKKTFDAVARDRAGGAGKRKRAA